MRLFTRSKNAMTYIIYTCIINNKIARIVIWNCLTSFQDMRRKREEIVAKWTSRAHKREAIADSSRVAGLKGKKLSRHWTRYKRAWYYAIRSQGWRRSFQLDLGKERRRSVLRFPLRRILYSPRCMTLLNTLVMICSSGFNVSPSWNRKQLSLCIRLGSDTLYTARNTITTTATSAMCPSSFSLSAPRHSLRPDTFSIDFPWKGVARSVLSAPHKEVKAKSRFESSTLGAIKGNRKTLTKPTADFKVTINNKSWSARRGRVGSAVDQKFRRFPIRGTKLLSPPLPRFPVP